MGPCYQAFLDLSAQSEAAVVAVDQTRTSEVGNHGVRLMGHMFADGYVPQTSFDTFEITARAKVRASAHQRLQGAEEDARLQAAFDALERAVRRALAVWQAHLDGLGIRRHVRVCLGERTTTHGGWDLLMAVDFAEARPFLVPFASEKVRLCPADQLDPDRAMLARRIRHLDLLHPARPSDTPWQVLVPSDLTQPYASDLKRYGYYQAPTAQDAFHQCAVFDHPKLLSLETPKGIVVAPSDHTLESLTTYA